MLGKVSIPLKFEVFVIFFFFFLLVDEMEHSTFVEQNVFPVLDYYPIYFG